MRNIRDMVAQEVRYCVTGLVETLANAEGHKAMDTAMQGLVEAAGELRASIPDYEEALIQAGWEAFLDARKVPCWRDTADGMTWAGTAEQVCSEFDIDPVDREVIEFWAVTDWLADQLIRHGEKVDKDFAGITIWARTNSGQSIDADSVIGSIYLETHREER